MCFSKVLSREKLMLMLMREDFLVPGAEIAHLLVVDGALMRVEVRPAETEEVARQVKVVVPDPNPNPTPSEDSGSSPKPLGPCLAPSISSSFLSFLSSASPSAPRLTGDGGGGGFVKIVTV